jgi:hypothetical protein
VETTLRLRDGEQHLLAGLIREEDRSTLRGFPGIMGIPVLRSLFGETDTAVRATEIVMLLTPRVVRTKELTQQDLSPIHIGTQTNFGLTEAPPLIAAQPDAGVPDTPAPDTGVPDVAPVVPDADVPDVDPVLPEPAPPVEPVPAPPTPEPAAPVEPEPALPPPSDQPQTLPGLPEPSAAGQVLVTPPGAVFRVGGGPYTVPISIAGVSQLSTISLTVFFDPNVLRVRTVQAGGTFMSQGGLEVSFTQEVDTAAGRIDITATRNNDATGASGAGLLAAVLFDAVGVGSVTLTTSGTALTPGGAPLALQFRPATVNVQ